MLYAMKNNRQTKINEDEKQKFINLGYKIAELKDGKLEFEEVETEEYIKIVSLNLEKTRLEDEVTTIKAENEVLKAELEALKVPKQGKTKEEGK